MIWFAISGLLAAIWTTNIVYRQKQKIKRLKKSNEEIALRIK